MSECAPVMLSSERKHSARPVQPPVTQPLSNPVTAPTPAQLVSDETASSISQKLDVGRERRCRVAGILFFLLPPFLPFDNCGIEEPDHAKAMKETGSLIASPGARMSWAIINTLSKPLLVLPNVRRLLPATLCPPRVAYSTQPLPPPSRPLLSSTRANATVQLQHEQHKYFP